MIKYDQIKEANETIKTTDIKGKDYAEVNQRIKAFRMVYPNGTITTDIVSLENGVVLMKTTVCNEEGQVIGTGYAQEKENSTFINKTSFIENCETSAVGRALGMCGFGIDTSVASAEEVQNAIANQDKPAEKVNNKVNKKVDPMTEEQAAIINGLDEKLKAFAIKKYSLNSIEDLNKEQAEYIIKSLKDKGVLK